MRSLYRTLSLGYFQQRWSRALLIMASITLGVATLVATRALNQSMWAATRAAFNPLASSADLHVSNGDLGVPRRLASRLAQIPGLRDAQPLIFGRARLPDIGDSRHAFVLGIDWKEEDGHTNPWGVKIDWTIPPERLAFLKGERIREWLTKLARVPLGVMGGDAKRTRIRPVLVGTELDAELKTLPVEGTLGRLLQNLLGKSWADELKTAKVRIQPVGQEPFTFIKVGTIKADPPAGDVIKNMLVMQTDDAAELLRMPSGLVSRIDLFLETGTDRDGVLSKVKEVVGGNAAVRTAEDEDERVEAMMAGLQLGFSLSGAAALIIALFFVYMVLSVNVVERRHEIGILRSLGATRPQVLGLFVGEAAVLGLVGATLGVPAGVGLAHLGVDPIQKILSDVFVALSGTRVQITADTVAIAVGAGVATALLAALVPALKASEEEPASAVRRAPVLPGWGHWALVLVASFVLLVMGATGVILRKHLPARSGTYGGFVLVLLGMLLTTPLLAALAARLLQPVARWFLGIEGRLAADNLVRAPGRTGLVMTVLAAGVAMFIQTSGVIRSNKDPILDWVDRSVAADLIVSSGSAITGSGQNLPLPAAFAATICNTFPQVEAALAVRMRQVDYGDQTVYLVALDAKGFASADRASSLPGRELYPRLYQRATPPPPLPDPRLGQVQGGDGAPALVSENFAALYRVGPGQSISLRGPHGPVPLQVAGTVEDYSFPRGTVIVDCDLYREQFDDPLVDEFYLYLRPGADPQVVRDGLLRRWEAKHALVVQWPQEVRGHLVELMNRFTGVAYAQEVVVGLVAALGVVTALLISVLQRRRELGILRAIGATRAQVLRSVLAEAILMGLIGTVIGLVVGVPVEWYIMHVILFEETGFVFPVLIPWLEAGFIAGAALAVATLAGLWPAIHTTRLRIPEAIAYE